MISTLDIHGLKENISDLKETVRESIFQENPNANVGNSERIVSLATGTFIFLKGIGNLFSHPTLALGEAVVGGLLKNSLTPYPDTDYIKNMVYQYANRYPERKRDF